MIPPIRSSKCPFAHNIPMKWLQLSVTTGAGMNLFFNQCMLYKHMSVIFFRFFPLVPHPKIHKLQINGFR